MHNHEFENGEMLVTVAGRVHHLPPYTAELYRSYLRDRETPALECEQARCSWAELQDCGLVPREDPMDFDRRQFLKTSGKAVAASVFITSAVLTDPAAAASSALCQADCAGFTLGTCVDCSSPSCDGSQCCFEIICVRSGSGSCTTDRPSGDVMCVPLAGAGAHQNRDCGMARANAVSGAGLFCTQSGDTGFFYACCESC